MIRFKCRSSSSVMNKISGGEPLGAASARRMALIMVAFGGVFISEVAISEVENIRRAAILNQTITFIGSVTLLYFLANS